jgi:1-phosphofructokinase family hexose kinase
VARIEKAVTARLDKAAWLMLCGSTPPGVPADFYARLIHAARERKVRCLLDTDGAALLAGVEARPSVVTPNLQEAERLLSRVLITRTHYREAAERIRAMGADSVILSLGSRGALGISSGAQLEAIPPRVDAVCPIGAGDALAAAFVWAQSKGKDFAESLRWAVAAGTASACLPGLCFAGLDKTREVFQGVEIRSVS